MVPGQEVDQRKLGERLWKKDCQARGLNKDDSMRTEPQPQAASTENLVKFVEDGVCS